MKSRLMHQAAVSSGRPYFGTFVPHIERLSLRSGHRSVFLPGCRVRCSHRTAPDAACLIPHTKPGIQLRILLVNHAVDMFNRPKV